MSQQGLAITKLGELIDLANVLAADATEESVSGTTPTQVKDMSFIIGVINYVQLTIEIEIKTSDNTIGPAICRVRHDELGSDDLVFTTTTNNAFEIFSGTIDTSAFGAGRHTVEFFLEDADAGETATIRETWVYGDE